ncbi:MAG: pantoate--beta-alanine ligase [Hyphomicrobiales bacterium]
MKKSIPVASSVSELRARIRRWHKQGLKTAIVPTMGALHNGHLSLVDTAFRHADRVVVSIFVNPTQFAAGEDLATYPSDDAGDLAKLKLHKTNLAYIPDVTEMYPDGFCTSIEMKGPALAKLEDRFRPHFFDGVATVVAKLIIQAQCNIAIFGEKDYQQLAVVTRLMQDLNIPTQIIGSETIREIDGLAMSSRNAYLSQKERARAALIHECLDEAAKNIRAGKKISNAMRNARSKLTKGGFNVDYVEARNAENLAKVKILEDGPLRLLCAAWLGNTRLIDNIAV